LYIPYICGQTNIPRYTNNI